MITEGSCDTKEISFKNIKNLTDLFWMVVYIKTFAYFKLVILKYFYVL